MFSKPKIEKLSDRVTLLLISDGVALPGWQRYSLAAMLVAVGVVLRLQLMPVDGRFALITLYPTALVCALVLGAGAGVFSVVVGAASASYYLIPPFRSFAMQAGSASALAIYVACCLVICLLAHQLRAAATRFHRNQQVFRSLYDTVEIGIVLTDMQGRFLQANEAYQRLSGYSLAELQSMNLIELTPPEGHAVERQQGELLKLTGHYGPFEKEMLRKDGSRAILRASGSRITNADGSDAVWRLVRDITETRRASETLQRNESRLRGIFTTLSEGLVVLQADGSIVDANPAAEQILALSRAQLLGKSPLDPGWRAIRENGAPLRGEDHPAMVTLRTGQPLRNQVLGVHDGSGTLRWLSVNSLRLPAQGAQDAPMTVASFVDISEQRESYRRIRELALQVDAVREEERRAVAQLLHESIAQDLFAARLRIRQLLAKARVGDGTAQACSEVGDALDKCMEGTRRMANSLRPAALSHMPLPEALREHAHYISDMTGVKVSVSVLGVFPQLKDSKQLALYRAAQELLSNVVRHARASSAAVLLEADASTVRMDIVDDGIGIDAAAAERANGLGLLGLRERCAALGGELIVQRNPEVGTTASIRLPRQQTAARLVS